MKKSFSVKTAAIHGKDVKKSYSPVTSSVYRSSTYLFGDTSEIDKFYRKELKFEYGRYNSPNLEALEPKFANLEGAEWSLFFNSGMSAYTTACLSVLKSGDNVIIGNDSYRRLRGFCTNNLARLGITTTVISMDNLASLPEAIQPNTRLLVLEMPTNPYLRVCDLEKIIKIAKQHPYLKTLIDTTSATPLILKPLSYGVDLVIHSASKYIAGHNDLIAGVVSGNCSELYESVVENRHMFGGICTPDNAWLIERSLKTLPIRFREHSENGLRVAQFLENHPLVESVSYPLLESHPEYELAKKYLGDLGGGMVTFKLNGDKLDCFKFIDNLELFRLADSFGGTESIVKHVAAISYYNYSEAERLQYNITDNLIRLSVGIEDGSDLIDDLARGLAAVSRKVALVSGI